METQQESSSRSQSQSCGREKKGQSQTDATGELHKCTPVSNLKKEQLQKKSVKPPARFYSNYELRRKSKSQLQKIWSVIINVKFDVEQQQQSGTDGPSEGITEDLPAATTDDGSDLDDEDFDERDDGEVHSGDDDEEIIDVGDPGNTDCHNTNLGALAALGPPAPLGAVAPPTTTIAAPRPLLPGSLLQV